MQDFEKHKEKFDKFLNRIDKNEKIGILAHANCVDGMISTVFLIEILKKKFPGIHPPSISFLSYTKGALAKQEEIFNRDGITKVFILDLGIDLDLLEEFNEFKRKFEVLFLDHHPINPNLLIDDKVIKTHQHDCTSLAVYRFGEKFLKDKRSIELACIASISEFSYKNGENLKLIQENFSFNPKDYQNSEIFQKVLKLNAVTVYYSKDSLKAYHLILNNDSKKIDEINKEINDELNRLLSDFEEKAERHFNNHLYFYIFSSKFSLGSTLSTALSVKKSGSTILIFSEISGTNMFKVSARNNGADLKYPMNEMIKAGIKGLNNAMGAGHAPASGGTFMKQDFEKFKENIIQFVKSKI